MMYLTLVQQHLVTLGEKMYTHVASGSIEQHRPTDRYACVEVMYVSHERRSEIRTKCVFRSPHFK